jgi:hypothetical protein
MTQTAHGGGLVEKPRDQMTSSPLSLGCGGVYSLCPCVAADYPRPVKKGANHSYAECVRNFSHEQRPPSPVGKFRQHATVWHAQGTPENIKGPPQTWEGVRKASARLQGGLSLSGAPGQKPCRCISVAWALSPECPHTSKASSPSELSFGLPEVGCSPRHIVNGSSEQRTKQFRSRTVDTLQTMGDLWKPKVFIEL